MEIRVLLLQPLLALCGRAAELAVLLGRTGRGQSSVIELDVGLLPRPDPYLLLAVTCRLKIGGLASVVLLDSGIAYDLRRTKEEERTEGQLFGTYYRSTGSSWVCVLVGRSPARAALLMPLGLDDMQTTLDCLDRKSRVYFLA